MYTGQNANTWIKFLSARGSLCEHSLHIMHSIWRVYRLECKRQMHKCFQPDLIMYACYVYTTIPSVHRSDCKIWTHLKSNFCNCPPARLEMPPLHFLIPAIGRSANDECTSNSHGAMLRDVHSTKLLHVYINACIVVVRVQTMNTLGTNFCQLPTSTHSSCEDTG